MVDKPTDPRVQPTKPFPLVKKKVDFEIDLGDGGDHSTVQPPGEVPPPSQEQEASVKRQQADNRSKWGSPFDPSVLVEKKRSQWGSPVDPSDLVEKQRSQWEPPVNPEVFFDNPFKALASLKQTSSAVKAPVRYSSSAMTPQTKGEKSIPEHLKELQIVFENLRLEALRHNKEENLKEIDKKYNGGQFFKKCNELNNIFPDKEFHSHLKKLVDTACAVQKNGAMFTNAIYKDKKDYHLRNDLSKARHDFAIAKREFEKEILRVGIQVRMKR